MFLSSPCCPMRIASIAGSGIKSLFTGIDSRDTAVLAVSSTHLIYSFMSFFYLFIYFFVIANIFFSNRSLGTFFHGFRIPFPFPFPDPRFHVLVLPQNQQQQRWQVLHLCFTIIPTHFTVLLILQALNNINNN